MSSQPGSNRVSSGLNIRTNLKAGSDVCYIWEDGYLVPIECPSPYPDLAKLDWTCNSCSGVKLADGGMKKAHCALCKSTPQ